MIRRKIRLTEGKETRSRSQLIKQLTPESINEETGVYDMISDLHRDYMRVANRSDREGRDLKDKMKEILKEFEGWSGSIRYMLHDAKDVDVDVVTLGLNVNVLYRRARKMVEDYRNLL